MRGHRQRLSEWISSDLTYLLSLLALGLIAYENSFFASFYLDDLRHILQNEAIVDLSNIGAILSYGRESFLPFLTLAINYEIGGLNPLSYHIFNFFIHYTAAIFLYFLCVETWNTPAVQDVSPRFSKQLAGLVTAGIFLLHPLQTEAVTYVIQRTESMAGMFYLATLYFYVRARLAGKRHIALGYFLLAGGGALGAAFSKATSVTLPAMIVTYELFLFNTSIKDLFRKKIVLLFLVPVAIILFFKLAPLIRKDFFYDPRIAYTRKQYFLTQLSVLLTYIRLYFWPVNQNIDWDYPVAGHFFALKTISSFLLLTALIVLAVLAYKRYRLVSLGIAAFFITLAPTSSIIPLHDVIFEHRMYMAVAFLAMGCVQVLIWTLEKVREVSLRGHYLAVATSMVALLLGLTTITHERNEVWVSSLSLWKDAVEKSPNKARPHNNYGTALYKLGMTMSEAAKREFEVANKISPEWEVPWHNLALAYFEEGDYQRAIEFDLEAIKIRQNFKPALYQLGRSYKELEQWDEARVYLERLIKLNRGFNYLSAYVELLTIYQEMGLQNKALKLAEKMTQLPDEFPLVDFHRGMAFYELNNFAGAKLYFTSEKERKLARTPSLLMLGQIHYLEKDYEQAAEMFNKILEENYSSPEANYNLAIILEKDMRFREALVHLESARAVDPFSLDISLQLIKCYGYLGYSEKRLELVSKVLGVRPDSEEFSFLQANMGQGLDRMLPGYAEKFLGGNPSPGSARGLAAIATLGEDYRDAIKWYERYVASLDDQEEIQRIRKEVLRLNSILQGKGPLRTPA
jgi:tetratricopeptide (TPR) repeat protein